MVTLFFSLFSPSWPLHDVLIAMRQQTAHGRVGNFGILGVPGFSVVGAGRAGRNELAAWIRHGHSMTCSPLCVSQQTAHGRVGNFGILGVPGFWREPQTAANFVHQAPGRGTPCTPDIPADPR